MKISVKGRYALASMISMAENYENKEYITVISISDKLGISKIYLEQVFSLLKRSGLVHSVKGAQGGYQLVRKPTEITVFDILSAVELSFFEKTVDTVSDKAFEIEKVMHESAFDILDLAVKETLQKITLHELVLTLEKNKSSSSLMFYI